MADNYFSQYITVSGGVFVADTSDIVTAVQNEWSDAFGSALSLEPATPQGRIIEMQTVGRKGMLESLAMTVNQINPNYATGIFLDADGALFACDRKGATRTEVACYLTGVPGTVIPASAQAQNTSGDVFYTPSAVTLDANGNANATFYAVSAGAVDCPAHTLTQIVTAAGGWETITNNTNGVVGSNTESDRDYRTRILKSRYSGITLLGAVHSELYKVSGLIDHALYNNASGAAVRWRDVTVDSHSICLIARGGTDADIASALYKTVTAGCGYTRITSGGTVVNQAITDRGGTLPVDYNITFNRPDAVRVSCAVSVGMGTYQGTSATLKAAISGSILNWQAGGNAKADAPHIGGTVSPFEIAAAISEDLPEIIIEDVRICSSGGSLGRAALPMKLYQYGSIPQNLIAVTVVG